MRLEINENITFQFNPLWQFDELQQTDIDLKTVQSVDIMTQSGAISSREAKDIYKNIDMKCMDGVDLNDEVIARQGGGSDPTQFIRGKDG